LNARWREWNEILKNKNCLLILSTIVLIQTTTNGDNQEENRRKLAIIYVETLNKSKLWCLSCMHFNLLCFAIACLLLYFMYNPCRLIGATKIGRAHVIELIERSCIFWNLNFLLLKYLNFWKPLTKFLNFF